MMLWLCHSLVLPGLEHQSALSVKTISAGMQYFESGRQYRFVSTASIPFVFKQKTAGATIIEIVTVCSQDETR